ncbi:DUF4007 family protein, partial [Alicyclobacillus cycloheptanicus]
MGYGQHQSFYLRVNWLRKAMRQLKADDRFFYNESAAEQIGLGKNMVQSLRYWVVATGIVNEVNHGKVVHEISDFGKLIDRFDPFIEQRDTASILHYHLVDNIEPSTTWYWFFNSFSGRTIKKSDIVDELLLWIVQNDAKQPSVNSLKRDIDCLVRLYCNGEKVDDPEEVIQSPLTVLGLLSEDKGIISKVSSRYTDIGLAALMYCLLSYTNNHPVEVLSIEEIEESPLLWGKVFNMQRNEIIRALEQLTVHPYYPISFDRTNKLNTVHLPKVTPCVFRIKSATESGKCRPPIPLINDHL